MVSNGTPDENAVGAAIRPTTSAGAPALDSQVCATPGPTTSRTSLPSSPVGTGGNGWPASAAATAARSAENVNVALTWSITRNAGLPVTPSGSVSTTGTASPVASVASAA